MATEKPRFTLTLDEDLLDKIDDFRFENRYPNRTQAVIELLKLGIAEVERGSRTDTEEENGERVLSERKEV